MMEASSYGIGLGLHVAMGTEHGLFMANDLVIAFLCALSYCAQVIYNLMEESPQERGAVLLNCSVREKVCPKEKQRRKRKKNKVKQTKTSG